MRSNPFAAARAQRIRIRAERLKAELRACHDAADADFLCGDQSIVPSHARALEMAGEPKWSRRVGVFITNAPDKRKRHRATGKPAGRPNNDDVGLARAVFAMMAKYRVDKAAAIRALARWLTEIEQRAVTRSDIKITFKAARERIYRALSH